MENGWQPRANRAGPRPLPLGMTRGKLLEIFCGILVEVLLAALATKLHFRVLMLEHKRLAHLAEFLSGDNTGRQRIRGLHAGSEHHRSCDDCGRASQHQCFHAFQYTSRHRFDIISFAAPKLRLPLVFGHFEPEDDGTCRVRPLSAKAQQKRGARFFIPGRRSSG